MLYKYILLKHSNFKISVSAKSLIQLVEDQQLLSFHQLIQFAGLQDAFENFGEYTLFAPSEAAMFCKYNAMNNLKYFY